MSCFVESKWECIAEVEAWCVASAVLICESWVKLHLQINVCCVHIFHIVFSFSELCYHDLFYFFQCAAGLKGYCRSRGRIRKLQYNTNCTEHDDQWLMYAQNKFIIWWRNSADKKNYICTHLFGDGRKPESECKPVGTYP